MRNLQELIVIDNALSYWDLEKKFLENYQEILIGLMRTALADDVLEVTLNIRKELKNIEPFCSKAPLVVSNKEISATNETGSSIKKPYLGRSHAITLFSTTAKVLEFTFLNRSSSLLSFGETSKRFDCVSVDTGFHPEPGDRSNDPEKGKRRSVV